MSQVVEAQPGGGAAGEPTDPSSYDGLALRQLTRHYGSFYAVRELDLDVPRGSFFALLGPSGCGKTTTLRMVAGLETPSSGTITLSGKDITWAKPYQRPVNTVFQSYALFPHLDIYENVAFGLRRRKTADVDSRGPGDARPGRARPARRGRSRPSSPAASSSGSRWPGPSSTVPRSCCSTSRSARSTSSCGVRCRSRSSGSRTEVGRTFIHVTHDQEEAMTMADTVAVMNAGVIEQMGAPAELYENPRSTFVANFLGQSNLIEGTIKNRAADMVSLDMHGIAVSIPADRAHAPGERGWVGIRPEKVLIGDEGEELDAPGNTIPGGVVSDVSFVGVSTQYLVRMPWGQELQVFSQNTGRTRIFAVGDKVELSWRPEYAFLLDAAQDASAGAQRADSDG